MEDLWADIKALFPFLLEVDWNQTSPPITHIPGGVCAFVEGEYSTHVALVLQGTIRVVKTAASGREIVLYRVSRGESCILLLSSVLAGIPYPAAAIVEEDAQVILVPARQFKEWSNNYLSLRNFVYQNLTQRLAAMMTLVEEIAFRRMDQRLAELLLNRTTPQQPQLKSTHEDIALDLGTAREVVSRLLRDFARESLVDVSRGRITVTNRPGLEQVLKSNS